MRKHSCFNHLLFTLLMTERFHPRVMETAEHTRLNTRQEETDSSLSVTSIHMLGKAEGTTGCAGSHSAWNLE